MNVFKSLTMASAMTMVLGSAVQAADMDYQAPAADPAMSGFYIRGDIGWSYLDYDGENDHSYVGQAGFGYQFTEMFRADITGAWGGEYEVGADELSTMALMGNAYFDLANSTPFTPYVGVGAGYGWVEGTGAIADDSGIAWGATAGVSTDITENMALDVGYKFRSIMVDGDEPMEHQVTAGLRFKF